MIFATNELPTIKNEQDEAFKGRVAIIDFPNRFKVTKKIEEEIPIQEFRNLARWCIKKLKEWSNNKKIDIKNLPSWEERVEDFTNRTNPMQTFCDQFIEIDEEDDIEWSSYKILCKDFQNEFNYWLESKGKKSMDSKKIGQLLSRTLKDKFKKMSSDISFINSENKKLRYKEYRGIRRRTERTERTTSSDSKSPMGNGVNTTSSIGSFDYSPSTARLRKGILAILDKKGEIETKTLIKMNANIDISILEQMKLEGLIYEPRSGILKKLEA